MLSSTTPKVIYSGNGDTYLWDFDFDALEATDVKVVVTNAAGTETLLTSGYSVDLIAKKIIYPTAASGLAKLPIGQKITIYREVEISQDTALTNQDGLYLKSLERALDKQTMISQQLAEGITRAVKMPVSSTESSEALAEAVLTKGDAIAAAAATAESARDAVIDMFNFSSGGNIIYLEPDANNDLMPSDTVKWGMSLPLPLLPPTASDSGKVIRVNSDRSALEYAAQTKSGVPYIVCLGDSITAGAPYYTGSVPPTEAQGISSWVRYVRDRVNFSVINKGIGGNSTTAMLARLEADVLALEPTHCILEFGLPDAYQGVPFATTQSNVESIISQLVLAGIVPIMVLPIPTRLYTSGSAAYHNGVDTIRSWIETYAATNGFATIDMYDAFRKSKTADILSDYFSDDLMHPSAEGYRVLGETVLRVLQSKLCSTGMPQIADKFKFAAYGKASNLDYESGDILWNLGASEGQWGMLAKSGDTADLWTWLGNLRNSNAKSPNYTAYYTDTDASNRYWQVDDLIFKHFVADNQLKIFRITAAGWTGAEHVGLSDACEAELLVTIPLSGGGSSTAVTWTAATFENSWGNSGGSWSPARFCKDAGGNVHVDGVVVGGATSTTIFTLPTGFRPPYNMCFASMSGGSFATIMVYADGRVQQSAGSTGVGLALCPISFRIDS